MSWFNLYWTRNDYEFEKYSRMMREGPYDPKVYTWDKFRKGERTPIPIGKKKLIYSRSWMICEKCESSDLDDIHHIDGNPSNHNFDNLIGVCKKCHRMLEHKKPIIIHDIG